MAQKKTKGTAEEAPQSDPAAPIDSKRLLKHLTRLLKLLEQDLLTRADGSLGLTEALKARHARELAAERTADGYDAWRRGVVTQVAAAWVLNVVFVRVLEDRSVVEHNRIAGPGASASERQFLELAPYLTERDYLLTVFRELSHFEVTRELFDPKKNLAFRITPSAEGAKQLLAVFRLGSAEAPAFRFGQSSTRFLGDLYQDLSEEVRKRYALLQTPDFIEAFILDRTLEPALETYGLDATTLIDPTCGSGHFLLGAFERLFDRQQKEHPNRSERDAALAALGSVYGTDINPYAVSIAKFRLVLAFLEKAGFKKLAAAPAVPLNVVTADSLYHQVAVEHAGQGDLGYQPGQKTRDWFGEAFALEEDEKAKAILGRGFAAVVGNPPYITVKDSALREKYRQQYVSASGKYALAAPFAERFFQLCRPGGYTGMITANSFMKRDFGKRLIEQVFPKVELQLVVNASGAYIPGHGTPTVLIFGQRTPPRRPLVRAVLAKRGEPYTPEHAERGQVWTSIVNHCDEVGFDNDYVSVVEMDAASLWRHPWSLGGGGATELKELLEERGAQRLGDIAVIGVFGMTNADECMLMPYHCWPRLGVESEFVRTLGIGEEIRDWGWCPTVFALYPYHWPSKLIDPADAPGAFKYLWPFRNVLGNRATFGGGTYFRDGLAWWKWHQVTSSRVEGTAIAFAFVATHNHFVLDRGGKVFKQSAPIIKLPGTATEDDHYALLAYLNSSTACFWMKQVFFPKYGAVKADHPDPARNFYEFAGTGLAKLPVPGGLAMLARYGKRMCALAEQRRAVLQRAARLTGLAELVTAQALLGVFRDSWREADALRRQMIHIQEEIDWNVYELFGLCTAKEAGLVNAAAADELTRGQRAFEAQGDRDSLVRRNGALLKAAEAEVETAPPTRLSPERSALVEARRRLLQGDPILALIENNVCKRLWRDTEQNQTESEYRAEFEREALETALLDLAERTMQTSDEPITLIPSVQASAFGQMVCEAAPTIEPAALLADAAVPYLAAMRYTATGLEKHREWLETWRKQRLEDAGQKVGAAPVPPKYASDDFQRASYWRHRGKLDVPKERFISYPDCESDDEKLAVYGWAGWNHLQRATALTRLYEARKSDGWEKTRLLPMLVGLIELLPWLHQYHDEPDESLGGDRPADQFEAFVAEELRLAGKTREQAEREVLAWAQQRGGGPQRKARPARIQRDDALESDTDADESAPDSEPTSAAPSSRAALKPPSKAKPRSKSKPANDTDVEDARPATKATRRGSKGGSR